MSSQIKSFLLLGLDPDSVQAEPGDGTKFSGPKLVARRAVKSRDATPPATARKLRQSFCSLKRSF